jgi:hypothetical protein
LPQPNTDSYSHGEFTALDTYANSYGNSYLYADKSDPDGYSYYNSYGFAKCDADTFGDPASADAKAETHTVAAADALRMKDPDSRVIGDQ